MSGSVFLLCFILCGVLIITTDAITRPREVILICYHKTGTKIVYDVIVPTIQSHYEKIRKHPSPVVNSSYSTPVAEALPQMSSSTKHVKVKAVGSPLVRNWAEKFIRDKDLRIIHFIRDPYDWVLSHYRYHKRGSENSWTSKMYAINFCVVDHQIITTMGILGISSNRHKSIVKELQNICFKLMGKESFYNRLMMLDERHGVYLAAISLIIGYSSLQGVLRAAINQMQFNIYHSRVLMLQTKYFNGRPVTPNPDYCMHSVTGSSRDNRASSLSFTAPNIHINTTGSDCGGSDLLSAMNNISKLLYSQEYKQLSMTDMLMRRYEEYSDSSESKAHITTTDTDTDKKLQDAINSLRSDPLLSVIFTRVEDIFYRKYTGV